MEQELKSGFYYSNKFAFIALKAYEDLIGKSNLTAILNLAGLNHLIDNFPPENLEREFDFSDFTAIHLALEEMYGPRGGQGLAQRAGRATFDEGLKNFGALAGVSHPAFKELTIKTRLQIVLPITARIFTMLSDQNTTVIETEGEFLWTISRCPICWNRHGVDKPVCYMTAGFLQALMAQVSDGLEFRVNESRCKAMGEEVCEFVIQKDPIIS